MNEGVNSRYLFQATRRQGAAPRKLVAVDLQSGARHTASESLSPHLSFPSGPGGTWAAHQELLFLDRQGDQIEVKAWSGPGRIRTLRSFPATILDQSNVAAHGNRVAWQQPRGDSLDLLIAESPNGQPRRLLTMGSMPGGNEISFSPDGKQLVLHYSTGPGSRDLITIVDASGQAPARIIDPGLSYWYWPRWMPDHSGVAVISGGAGAESNVVLVPIREGAKPVNLTQADPASKWGFELSPDGRFIAYPGEIGKGSSEWKINLDGAAPR